MSLQSIIQCEVKHLSLFTGSFVFGLVIAHTLFSPSQSASYSPQPLAEARMCTISNEKGTGIPVNNCELYAEKDEELLRTFLEQTQTSRVIMFGIDHGTYEGDRVDGEFVAGLLPYFQDRGWDYVGIEAPRRLNNSIGQNDFTYQVMEEFKQHWTEFGPVIQKARELGMHLIFYDVDNGNVSAEREKQSFEYLKANVFDKDPNAGLVIYCGASHINQVPVSTGNWLEPGENIKPLGMLLKEFVGEQLITVNIYPAQLTWRERDINPSFYLGKLCDNYTSKRSNSPLLHQML